MTKSCMECPDGSWFTQLLRDAQPLPIRLAQRVAATKPGHPDNEWLHRLHTALSPADKLQFLGELYACRLAQRGKILAEVA